MRVENKKPKNKYYLDRLLPGAVFRTGGDYYIKTSRVTENGTHVCVEIENGSCRDFNCGLQVEYCPGAEVVGL